MPDPVVTQADGSFEAQFLVVSGDDVFGQRDLQATIQVFVTTVEGLSLATTRLVAVAPFLVVPHTAEPPTVDIMRNPWGQNPMFFRH